MKKLLIAAGVLILLVICGVAVFILSPGTVDPHNAFDEIYNEVRAVERGGESILVSATESAYADYDLGSFQNIQIPDLDMCLDIYDNDLHILFFNGSKSTADYVHFKYDPDTRTLYGNRTEDHLFDGFLTHYFKWLASANETSNYSETDPGEYTYVYTETVNW